MHDLLLRSVKIGPYNVLHAMCSCDEELAQDQANYVQNRHKPKQRQPKRLYMIWSLALRTCEQITLRCCGIFHNNFITNLLMKLKLKEILKLVNISQVMEKVHCHVPFDSLCFAPCVIVYSLRTKGNGQPSYLFVAV